ncbi:hypothetical protein CsSME_00040825 [Camellia sinensis var. sinensis]|uniref:Uncharacterized protein n=1 Tax=Camellia sinensis TaxID=4442 RepID=A0A7J7FS38_CAMSI|nr:hypothetical protein HYC85_031780 [Camellia sinensis]
MATTPSNPPKSLPPKRGQIKAQIFASCVHKLASITSKAGEALGKIGSGGGGGGGGGGGSGNGRGSSTSGTPPPSTYNSDGNA